MTPWWCTPWPSPRNLDDGPGLRNLDDVRRLACFRLFHLRSRSGQLGTWGGLLQRSPHRADIQSALGVQRVEQCPVGHRERPGTG